MAKQFGTPGPRTMKPEVATDPALARCSLGAQLLFDRLIVNSDDQGRQIGDPIVVKAASLPRVADATLTRVKNWLGELETQELIVRYVAQGEPLIQLTGWWRHQDNQRRIFPSRWPSPEGWTDRVKVEPGRLPADEPPPDDAPWPADGPPDAGQTPAGGAPMAGHWPRKVSPSLAKPLATASADRDTKDSQQPKAVGARAPSEADSWFEPPPDAAVDPVEVGR